MHSSLKDIMEHMDINTLPKEYGGSIPMADMIGRYYDLTFREIIK